MQRTSNPIVEIDRITAPAIKAVGVERRLAERIAENSRKIDNLTVQVIKNSARLDAYQAGV